MIVQTLAAGFRIGEVSCPTRYAPDSSSIGLRSSLRYGLGVLATAAEYRMDRWGLRRCPYLHAPDPAAAGAVAGEAVEIRQAGGTGG